MFEYEELAEDDEYQKYEHFLDSIGDRNWIV